MATLIAACSHCGSPRVYPKIWVQGFLPTINDERQTYVCRDCDREGMLLHFESEAARGKYAEECRTKATPPEAPSKPASEAIPIVPIDAVPLLEVRGIDAVPIYRPKIVDVRWTDGRLRRGGFRLDVGTYWEVVGGPRYTATRIYVLDLAGIHDRHPNFEEVGRIAKRATVLYHLGVYDPEDVMDGFMLDVESIVAGTSTLRSSDQLAEIRDLSDGVVPCLDVADGVVWSSRSNEDRDLRSVAAKLRAIGFTSLAVMDLRRLGTFSGPDPALVEAIKGLDFDLLLGGGIREEDVAGLREAGIGRALIDPFTPVIRALLPTKREEAPTDAVEEPKPVRDVRGAPTPG